MAGHTRWQRPPGWTAAKEVAVALAGAAAVGADAGMPLRPSELESILELERRSDLVDRLRRDPALAEEARRMAERIAFEELASIRALADTLAGCVGLDVPSTEYEPGHDEV
jgi:hypothetical protein